MELKEFLSTCSYEEFINWLKDVCIGDSFNNIKENKSFKLIMINTISDDNEYSYYTLGERDTINDYYYELKTYAEQYPNEAIGLFELKEDTKAFAYSYTEELLLSKCKELEGLIVFLKDNLLN